MDAQLVIIVDGGKAGKSFPLMAGAPATLGRSLKNRIMVDDPLISSRHLQLVARNGEWWVCDLKSTNGTAINGQRVTEARLNPGDVLTVGNTQLRFHRTSPSPRGGLLSASSAPIKQAIQLADSGRLDSAFDLLRPLVADENSRVAALSAMALSCRRAGQLSAGRYLFDVILRTRPDNELLCQEARACDTAYKDAVNEVRVNRPDTQRLWIGLCLILLGVGIAAGAIPGASADIFELITRLDSEKWIVEILSLAGAFSLGGLVLVFAQVRRVWHYWAGLRAAVGENYNDRRRRNCWRCGLRYEKRQRACPWCAAPKKAPKPQKVKAPKPSRFKETRPVPPGPDGAQPPPAKPVPSAARQDALAAQSPPFPDEITDGGQMSAPQAVAVGSLHLRLPNITATVGRRADCSFHLPHLTVSRLHARITPQEGGHIIEDTNSTNGVFVNGRRVNRHLLQPDEDLAIGPYLLTYDGRALKSLTQTAGTQIFVHDLGKEVRDRNGRKSLFLLRNISLTIRGGQFIGVMGSSGCGKSTFMDALNGRRPATEGNVYYNGLDLCRRFESLKTGIGYVPQHIIFHEMLPVEKALRYTSVLRLSSDITARELDENIDRVLATVGLRERKNTIIRDLSGGQKKRVSIAMELLSHPTTLFLDEVTSGLDVGTERLMMKLFRELADGGVTVACISHFVDSLDICDRVVYFNKGRLAFYGPPGAMKRYFNIKAISDIYQMEIENPDAEWESRFRQSPEYQEYVAKQRGLALDAGSAKAAPEELKPAKARGGFGRQFPTLTRRYLNCMFADLKSMAILFLLGPAIAMLLCILASSMKAPDHMLTQNDYREYESNVEVNHDLKQFGVFVQKQNNILAHEQSILYFGAILTAFFLGLFGSIREIVKELSIYSHERFSNLQITPYLFSKIIPLAAIGAIQCLAILLVINYVGDLNSGPLWRQFLVLFQVSLCGLLLGLVISAAVPSSDRAVLLMIGVVIPQLLFSGALVPIKGVAAVIAKTFIVCFWSFRSFSGMQSHDIQKILFDDVPAKGIHWILCSLMHLVFMAIYMVLLYGFMLKKDGLSFKTMARQLIVWKRRAS